MQIIFKRAFPTGSRIPAYFLKSQQRFCFDFDTSRQKYIKSLNGYKNGTNIEIQTYGCLTGLLRCDPVLGFTFNRQNLCAAAIIGPAGVFTKQEGRFISSSTISSS